MRRKTQTILFRSAACLLAAALALGRAPAQAAPATGHLVVVNITADEYNTIGAGTGCSLREAIQAMNNGAAFGGCLRVASGTVDRISLPSGVYFLTRSGAGEDLNATGDLDITAGVVISGTGATPPVVRGAALLWDDRVLHVHSGEVALNGVTIRQGDVAGRGGGILNDATLTLNDSLVAANKATQGGGGIHNNGTLALNRSVVQNNTGSSGGGIHNALGAVTIVDSTIASNEAQFGGGGLINVGGQATIIGSAFSGNEAALSSLNGSGGGIENVHQGEALPALTIVNSTLSGNITSGLGGGLAHFTPGAVVELSNVTITGNTAGANNGVTFSAGGGLYFLAAGPVRIRNSIVAGNFDVQTSGPANPDCRGAFTGFGAVLIQDTTGCDIDFSPTNLLGVDPKLGPLRDNGGPTQTHALLPGSPAIEAGVATGCVDHLGDPLATDQRGRNRHVDADRDGNAVCDIGAFEFPMRLFLPGIISEQPIP